MEDQDISLSLISPWQSEAIRCLVIDGKNVRETSEYLNSKGYDVSVSKLKRFSKSLASTVVETEKLNIAKEYLLNSMERVTEEFEEINRRTKDLLDKFEKEDNAFMQLVVIKELREQIKIALVKLGEYKSSIIGINNMNVVTSQDIVDKFRRMQISYFETMNAVLNEGQLIYRKPSVELVDSYNRYRAMKKGLIKSPDSDSIKIEA